MSQTKTCTKCGKAKPLASFYKHPRTADRRQTRCKVCQKHPNGNFPAMSRKQKRIVDFLNDEGIEPLKIAHMLGIKTGTVRQHINDGE